MCASLAVGVEISLNITRDILWNCIGVSIDISDQLIREDEKRSKLEEALVAAHLRKQLNQEAFTNAVKDNDLGSRRSISHQEPAHLEPAARVLIVDNEYG